MTDRTPEYWTIVKESFPEAHEAHARELAHQRELEQKALKQSKEEQQMRIDRASQDPRIADYLVHGDGDEVSLVAELQRDHGLLSEAEAIIALHQGLNELHDKWVDHGEA